MEFWCVVHQKEKEPMRYCIVSILFFSAIISSYSQEKLVKINFVDARMGEKSFPTEVKVTNAGSGAVISEKSGYFIVTNEDVKLRVVVNDPDYSKLDTVLTISNFFLGRKNRLELTLPVRFKGQFVGGVDIHAEYRPIIVFQSDTLHVQDFEVVSPEITILLTYPKKLQKGSRLLLLLHNQIQASIDIPMAWPAIKLIKGYQGEVYLMCQDRIYLVLFARSSIQLRVFDEDYFYEFVSPVVDTLESNYFVSNYSEWYPAFEYYGLNMQNPVHHRLLQIQDDLMMELYRAEYKWADVRTKLWAWDMERETGVDRQIWVGATQFTQSLFYEPLYAPLFLKGDTVFICDHYKDSLFMFDGDFFNFIGAHPISYHQDKKKTGWRKEVLQDPVTQKIYIIYMYAGYTVLRELNTGTGRVMSSFALHYRFVEKVRVYNGEVYYTYRPFESLQKKYLYKESLNKMAKEILGFHAIR